MSSTERAQRIVQNYAKGLICSGEVLNLFLDHISDTEVESFMGVLSPELIRRFQHTLGLESDYPLAPPELLKRIRHAEGLIRVWLRRRNPEPAASPNGGPAEPPGNSGVGGGAPSVS